MTEPMASPRRTGGLTGRPSRTQRSRARRYSWRTLAPAVTLVGDEGHSQHDPQVELFLVACRAVGRLGEQVEGVGERVDGLLVRGRPDRELGALR